MGKILASPYLGLEGDDLDDTGRHPNHCVHRTLGVIPYKSLLKVDRLTLHEFAWDQTSPWLFNNPLMIVEIPAKAPLPFLTQKHNMYLNIHRVPNSNKAYHLLIGVETERGQRWHARSLGEVRTGVMILLIPENRGNPKTGDMVKRKPNVEASLTPHPLPIIPLFDVPRARGVNLTCDGDEAETNDRVDSNLRAPPPSSSSSGFSGNSPSSNPSAYLSYFLISRFNSSLFPLLFSLDSLLKSQKKTPPPQSFSQRFIATPANPFYFGFRFSFSEKLRRFLHFFFSFEISSFSI
ncbi:hypothetical protein VNO77_43454 [Canavalia gladiata]|uniref:Uncharacterized protein n=1 Tax=Canavalia gladiata TaxID=3824 RepID=A0AAN9JWG9_CANGL